MRQMPQEGRRFGVVDQHWRKTMDAARRTPNALEFLETESLLKGFTVGTFAAALLWLEACL